MIPFERVGRLASGVYRRSDVALTSGALERVVVETVRLDVDGDLPQMVASGTYHPATFVASFHEPTHWLAHPLVEKKPGEEWEGPIVQRWPWDGGLVPHKTVTIRVPPGPVGVVGPELSITFSGNAPAVTRKLQWESPYFRTAEFEFDREPGAPQVTAVNTHAHAKRPADLPGEWLSIDKVYDRAGIEVLQSPNRSDAAIVGPAGEFLTGLPWSDQELHDAMRVYWSRYRPRAQWALWFLFARDHVDPDTGGIMFDFQDPQRQGAALFSNALDRRLPGGEPQPGEWMARQRFFAAVHEIGHCFNLLHSWEKDLGVPWVPRLGPDPEAMSFMNYPHKYKFGYDSFFAGFRYRFDDLETVYLRHAPDEFVQMGAAPAGQDSGFRNRRPAAHPTLALGLAVRRARPVFEFLEPVILDLELTNVGGEPELVDPALFAGGHDLTVLVQPRSGPARRWRPYVRRCSFGGVKLLRPGQSLRASIFVSAGLDGWHLAEPGSYTLHARVGRGGEEVAAGPLDLRIASPRSWDEDYLARDFFTDEVGRALAMGGTYAMTAAIAALEEAADRLPERAVARHAALVLARPRMEDRRMLGLPEGRSRMSSVAADGGCLQRVEARPDEARRLLHAALLEDAEAAARTFGRSGYGEHLERYADWLEKHGDAAAAAAARARADLAGVPPGGDADAGYATRPVTPRRRRNPRPRR